MGVWRERAGQGVCAAMRGRRRTGARRPRWRGHGGSGPAVPRRGALVARRRCSHGCWPGFGVEAQPWSGAGAGKGRRLGWCGSNREGRKTEEWRGEAAPWPGGGRRPWLPALLLRGDEAERRGKESGADPWGPPLKPATRSPTCG